MFAARNMVLSGQIARPLDVITAAAAYSVRLLRTSYTGQCMRVRRSSDNVEADIGFNTSGDLDLTALLAHCGANSGFVRTWYDQSGNARDATQTVAGTQPRIVNAGVVETQNGRPTLFFNAQKLTVAAAFATRHVFTAIRWSGALPFGAGTFKGVTGFDGASNVIFGVPNSSTNLATAMPSGVLRTNGVQTNVGSPATLQAVNVSGSGFTGAWNIGRGDSESNYWTGPISEIVFCPDPVTPSLVERNQGSYYGITVS